LDFALKKKGKKDVKGMDEETGETVRTEIYESVWKKL
tara:strand:+ start:284 stop:394 length:111 start_codon:yes stop_codon:yes gene_type:complete